MVFFLGHPLKLLVSNLVEYIQNSMVLNQNSNYGDLVIIATLFMSGSISILSKILDGKVVSWKKEYVNTFSNV